MKKTIIKRITTLLLALVITVTSLSFNPVNANAAAVKKPVLNYKSAYYNTSSITIKVKKPVKGVKYYYTINGKKPNNKSKKLTKKGFKLTCSRMVKVIGYKGKKKSAVATYRYKVYKSTNSAAPVTPSIPYTPVVVKPVTEATTATQPSTETTTETTEATTTEKKEETTATTTTEKKEETTTATTTEKKEETTTESTTEKKEETTPSETKDYEFTKAYITAANGNAAMQKEIDAAQTPKEFWDEHDFLECSDWVSNHGLLNNGTSNFHMVNAFKFVKGYEKNPNSTDQETIDGPYIPAQDQIRCSPNGQIKLNVALNSIGKPISKVTLYADGRKATGTETLVIDYSNKNVVSNDGTLRFKFVAICDGVKWEGSFRVEPESSTSIKVASKYKLWGSDTVGYVSSLGNNSDSYIYTEQESDASYAITGKSTDSILGSSMKTDSVDFDPLRDFSNPEKLKQMEISLKTVGLESHTGQLLTSAQAKRIISTFHFNQDTTIEEKVNKCEEWVSKHTLLTNNCTRADSTGDCRACSDIGYQAEKLDPDFHSGGCQTSASYFYYLARYCGIKTWIISSHTHVYNLIEVNGHLFRIDCFMTGSGNVCEGTVRILGTNNYVTMDPSDVAAFLVSNEFKDACYFGTIAAGRYSNATANYNFNNRDLYGYEVNK